MGKDYTRAFKEVTKGEAVVPRHHYGLSSYSPTLIYRPLYQVKLHPMVTHIPPSNSWILLQHLPTTQ